MFEVGVFGFEGGFKMNLKYYNIMLIVNLIKLKVKLIDLQQKILVYFVIFIDENN